jgi:hypothetical protein
MTVAVLGSHGLGRLERGFKPLLAGVAHRLMLTKVFFRILLKRRLASQCAEEVCLAHMPGSVLRLAFIYFHPANRVCASFGPRPSIVLLLASLFMHSFDEFDVSYQANAKTRGWSNDSPGSP